LWKGHINPILLAIGIFAAWYGLKNMYKEKQIVL